MIAPPGQLPEGWTGQALALLVLGGFLLMAWLAIGAPLADWYAERADRLTQQRQLVAHMRDVAGMLPELARQAKQTPLAIGTDTDALIAARLQQRLTQLAATAGTEIATAEALPPEQAGGVDRIRLRLTLQAPLPALLKLLGAIETATPPLLVDDLDVTAGEPHDNDWPPLQVRFSVITLRASTVAGTAP
jgi:general secretion pathway protein M